MSNLSYEQLKKIVETDHVQCGDAFAMARELLAYREAQGEPVAWEVKGILCHTLEEANVYVGEPEPLYAAPQLPALPDVLPCPVKLEPGLTLGKGVKTQALLDALIRREKYYAELEAMTPEQRAEKGKLMDELRQMLGHSKPTDDERIMAIEGIIQPLDEFDSSSQQFESLRRGESD